MSEYTTGDINPPAPGGYEPYPLEYARRYVTVRRTSGELDKGWLIDGELTDAQGIDRYVLVKYNEDGSSLEKRVPKEQIDQLQAELAYARESQDVGKAPRGLGGAAIRPTIDAPMIDRDTLSLDDKIALGWAVPRSALRHLQDKESISLSDPEHQRYEKLFAFPNPAGKDRYDSSFRERTSVTDESAHDAAVAYRYATTDEVIRGLFDRFKGDAWRDEDMAEVLRTTPELRVELGEYLLKKMDEMGSNLPERVWRNAANNSKNPNFPGYSDYRLSSREYAALLAVSMLDGTFKAERSPSDTIEINRYREVITGQHRYAAHQVLGTQRLAHVEYVDR